MATLYAGLGLIAAGLLVDLIDLVDTTSTAPYEDEAAKQEVVCQIYARMFGVTPTYALWSNAADVPLSGNAEKIRVATSGLMQDDTGFLEFMGLMVDVIEAATEAELENTCGGCVWYHDEDLTATDGGYVRWTSSGFNHGTWVDGSGWDVSDGIRSGAYNRALAIQLTVPAADFTKVRVTYAITSWPTVLPGTATCYSQQLRPGNDIVDVTAASRGAPRTFDVDLDTTDQDQTSLEILLRVYLNTTSTYTGAGYVTRVQYWGTGDNPFD